MDYPTPLCSLPPWSFPNSSLDWVLKKVEEIRGCVGLSYESFEEQFKTLLVVIEAECQRF